MSLNETWRRERGIVRRQIVIDCGIYDLSRQRSGRAPLMRINIWIILATLLALLAITRYMQHEKDTERICVDDPTASVCHR